MGGSLLLSPFVLATDLILLLRSEIVLNVESLADLLWRLALDHIGDSLAPNVEKSLDIKIVGSKDDFKKHLLINLHELLVPLFDVSGLLSRIRIIFVVVDWVTLVMFAPFDDLLQDGLVDL